MCCDLFNPKSYICTPSNTSITLVIVHWHEDLHVYAHCCKTILSNRGLTQHEEKLLE